MGILRPTSGPHSAWSPYTPPSATDCRTRVSKFSTRIPAHLWYGIEAIATRCARLRKQGIESSGAGKICWKKGNKLYRWFAQLRLVFWGKPHSYGSDLDKVAYALSYMTRTAQNWAMPFLHALDKGRAHELLIDYKAFREAIIGVYGVLDRTGNAKDRLSRLQQTRFVASYISTFNEYSA